MPNILFLLFFLLLSCNNYQPVDNISNAPKWYVNALQNDNTYLYGVGYGNSLQDSTKIALNNISEKILVTVSSSFTMNNQESVVNNNSDYESRQQQNIILQVKEIDFTNYQLIKSEQIGQGIYSLVKVKREDLINYYLAKIKKDHVKIKSNTNNLVDFSHIEQFIKINKIKNLINKNEVKLELLEILGANHNILNQYTKYYNFLLDKQTWLKNNIALKIVSPSSEQRIVNVIAKALNDIGIKVIVNTEQAEKSIFLLRITADSRTEYIYNSYITKIIINTKLIKSFGSQIAAGEIIIKGSSVTNKVMAFDAAIVNLQNDIAKFGIFSLVGL